MVDIERREHLRTVLKYGKEDGLRACLEQAKDQEEIAICEEPRYFLIFKNNDDIFPIKAVKTSSYPKKYGKYVVEEGDEGDFNDCKLQLIHRVEIIEE